MTDPVRRAEARVATENASKYLQQLCKHFQHKLPASFDPAAGAITFPMGEVKLAAEPQTLALALESASDEDLERLKDVVARHLLRFAFREELTVDWRAAA
jgi:uncharacterized protein